MGYNLIIVMLGGSLGAVGRYAFSLLIKKIVSSHFPIATFTVNILGSFLLGIIIASNISNYLLLFLGIGFMGSFTTFSTFQVENVNLFKMGKYKTLILYVFGSILFCIVAAICGYSIGIK